jgi:hypothetical protein
MKIASLATSALCLVFGLFFGWILTMILAVSASEGFLFSRGFALGMAVYGLGFAACVYGFVRGLRAVLPKTVL